MEIFQLTKTFPNEEKYSLIDQIRRSSRSVCANLAEAWRKRQYRAAFVAKLVEAESEANETQVWLEFAERCGYLNVARAGEISRLYDQVLGQLILIKEQPDKWTISASGDREKRVRL
jgi:four helix bundle protein